MAVADAAISRRDQLLKLLGFVLRCALSAVLATWLSDFLGMRHSVWATMSALIVSQEQFAATRTQIAGRVAGTITGAVVALLVSRVGLSLVPMPLLMEVAIGVGICAVIASQRATWRVCLWTCPLVLLTATPGEPPELTAASRTAEVLLGALIAGFVHLAQNGFLRCFGVSESGLPIEAEKRQAAGGD